MIYLTYDHKKLPDGLGAQYHRVLGILALANFYNFKYIHTPINFFEHSVSPRLAEDFFQIKNHYSDDSIDFDLIFELENPIPEQFFVINKRFSNKNKNILIKIWNPFVSLIENKCFDYFDVEIPKLRGILSKREIIFDKNILNISIHIRRNDITKDHFRYKNINYFLNIIDGLQKTYCVKKKIHIFTQISNDNKNEFDIFDQIEEVSIHANGDVFSDLYHMIESDVLVTGGSGFSSVAALYNKSIVYYLPKILFDGSTTQKLSRWKSIDDLMLKN